jgi:glycosyltransferase involved in cell wall biosynthesis
MTAPATAPGTTAEPQRVARLSYFFPAHNEEANLEGLVQEALETLPSIAETFEIIAVNDGSRDRTREIADRLAAEHPDVVRAVHHDVNRGYGGALRSGFEASRYELLAFTDGDRQFRIVDIARLTERLAAADHPDVVVGYRIKRADPIIRIVYARTYKLANRIFYGLRVRDVDCACKLFRREALEGVRVESGGAFFSAELLVKIGEQGRSIAEVGIPHYARTAGPPTGARPSVIGRAVKDFWMLRLRLWANADRARRRGRPILGD